MKRALLWSGVVLALLAGAFGYAHLRTDTYLGRWFAWRASDVGDVDRFPALQIAPSGHPVAFETQEASEPLLDMVIGDTPSGASSTPDDRSAGTLRGLLSGSDTTAFVVLSGGVVAAEWYSVGPPETARGSTVTSFSVAKSVTALLVGAALEDGQIGSLDDPVTSYLPGLREVDAGYDRVTLRHLLDMRSGVRFRDHDLPWGDKARVYYEPHLRGLVTNLPLVGAPGGAFAYNSYNPVLLGLVLEAATGENVASYLERRLWGPVGAERRASWSVSSPGETLPKMESGLNATALDMARLGQLVLDGGAVAGEQVVSMELIEDVSDPDPARSVDAAAGLHYQLGWWVYAPERGRPMAIAGQGHLGQYLFVYPELDVVIARFGTSMGGVASWRSVFDQVALAASRNQ